MRTNQSEIFVDVSGEIRGVEHLRNISIREESQGKVVRLGDFATVTRGTVDPPSSIALVHGRPAIMIAMKIEEEKRIDLWRAKIEDQLTGFRSMLPKGIGLNVVFDESIYTSDRASHLNLSLGLGVICVVIVVFLMMGSKAVLPVCAALPLAILMVLAGLAWLGQSIQQMSIAGLIVSIGMLIDNPIIMVDEVLKRFAWWRIAGVGNCR